MKKSKVYILSLTLVFTLLLSACSMLKDAAALTEYDFETDKVSSVNSVIGDEREVTGVKSGSSNGIQYKEYTYKTESTGDDLLAYANHLLEAGWIPLDNFNVTDSEGTGRLAIQSADEGKILIMTLTFQEGEYTIRTEKSEGALTPK